MIPRNFSIARTNRYMVSIVPPSLPGLGLLSFKESQIESVSMPNQSVATQDYDLDNFPMFKVPYRRVPEGTVNIRFRMEENGASRKSLKAWMNAILGERNNLYYSKYYNEIAGTVGIYQLDTENKFRFGVVLRNAFPINMDAIELSWGDTNNYMTQSVTFAYFDEQLL
jgi:hypothetical protein